MLRRIAFLLLVLVLSPAVFATQRGEKSLGLRAGYNTSNTSAVAGIFFQYSFSSHFRLAPAVDYVFRNNDVDGLAINIDCDFPIGLRTRRFDIYPLAGVTWLTMSNRKKVNADDASTRESRLGFNIGAGCEYYIMPSLKVYVEGKFSCVKHYNSGVFAAGIGYVF